MQKSSHNRSARRPTNSLLLPATLGLCIASTLAGQSFPSGSTGADGALNITATNVTTLPAPKGGGNIYNFTTITVAQGSTLKLTGAVFPGPIYFLATGAVTIAGTIDLSGQSGLVRATTSARQTVGPTMPGAGGYGGGEGYFAATEVQLPGLGPLGGAVNGGCYSSGGGGGFNGSQFLLPLVGGSGGAGSFGSGGAGGGALLIASSVSITVTGTITANGGNGADSSGGGAGGGIRLVAPTIAGNGLITAAGGGAGNGNNCNGGRQRHRPGGIFSVHLHRYDWWHFLHGNPRQPFSARCKCPAFHHGHQHWRKGCQYQPNGDFHGPRRQCEFECAGDGEHRGKKRSPRNDPDHLLPDRKLPKSEDHGQRTCRYPAASSTATATVTLNPGYSIGYVVAQWTQ